MLKIIFLSLFIGIFNTKLNWFHKSQLIFFLCSTSMVIVMGYPNLFLVNSYMMVDIMVSSLICMSIYITGLMFLASSVVYTMKKNDNLFSSVIMTLMFILILAFSSSNFVFFYIFFEASLIPTMMLIMMWGYQPERIPASMYMMIYTVTASLPLLMSLFFMYEKSGLLLMTITSSPFYKMSIVWWILMILAFLVKLPMFPFHLWLPKAHVEAPVAGSMILAAILLKLGGYGLVRLFMIYSWPGAALCEFLIGLSLMGALLSSLVCLRQTDMKSLIAYSSVGHMGIMIAASVTSSYYGTMSSLTMMIAHALSSSGLFSLANMSYEYSKTRSLMLTKGIMFIMPLSALIWFLMIMCNMAAPPFINIIAEIYIISSIISFSFWWSFFLMMVSFLTVCYSLHLYSSIHHGQASSFCMPIKSFNSNKLATSFLHIIPAGLLVVKPELVFFVY